MATTTIRRETSMSRMRLNKFALLILGTMGCSGIGYAQTVVAPAVKTELVAYDRSFDDGVDTSNQALNLTPSITVLSKTPYSHLNAQLRHERLISFDQDVTESRGFTDLLLDSRSTFGSDFFALSANASQTYAVFDPTNALVSDRIAAPANFAKHQRYGANVALTNPNKGLVTASMMLGYSFNKTDTLDGRDTQYDYENDSMSASVNLGSGQQVSSVIWSLSAQQVEIDRDIRGDYDTTHLDALMSFPLYRNFRLVTTGSYQSTQLGNPTETSGADELYQKSYGVGLEYTDASGYIRITYNDSERQYRDVIEEQYVGVDLSWKLSQRTSVQGSYGKAFYGDNYSLGIQHQMKRWKTSIRYNESVANPTRVANRTQTTSLVCPQFDDSATLADCYIPDIGYELDNDEQFIDFSTVSPELVDSVVITKAWNINASYQGKRYVAGIGLGLQDREYIELTRDRDQKNATAYVRYDLNRNKRVNAQFRWFEGNSIVTAGAETSTRYSVAFEQNLNERLMVSSALIHLNRNSPLQSRSVSDNRVTLSATYQF